MNTDQMLITFSEVVLEILNEVVTFEDILNDEKRLALLQSIFEAIDRLGLIAEEVLPAAILNAYWEGADEAADLMTALTKTAPAVEQVAAVTVAAAAAAPVTPVQLKIHLAAVSNIVSDTMVDMLAAFRSAKESATQTVEQTLVNVRKEIAAGMIRGEHSKQIAKQRVAKAFAEGGLTAFTTKDGKRLPLDFYARTVTRTKIRTAHVNGSTQRYTDAGVGLVQISGSNPSCKVCARYRGMVFSLTGEHEGYPSIQDERYRFCPFHPNCRCNAHPYVIEFISTEEVAKEKAKWKGFDPEEDTRTAAQKKAYKAEQDIRREANQEKKAYAAMQAALGDKAPKTIGAFRRMKRKNDDKWKQLQSDYMKLIRSI